MDTLFCEGGSEREQRTREGKGREGEKEEREENRHERGCEGRTSRGREKDRKAFLHRSPNGSFLQGKVEKNNSRQIQKQEKEQHPEPEGEAEAEAEIMGPGRGWRRMVEEVRKDNQLPASLSLPALELVVAGLSLLSFLVK